MITKITKDMLPNLPDEIFEMFIIPQNEAPPNIFDSQPQGRWFFHFGGLSTDEFNKLRWHRTELFFDKEIFHPDTYADINRLVKFHSIRNIDEANTLFPGNPSDSGERIIWHREAIVNTGRLCAPIVCIKTSIGIKMLDGVHRIVAALSLSIDDSKKIPLDAWIGEP